MARNRSLDEFGDPDASNTDSVESTDSAGSHVTPLRPTYAWDPAGGVCGRCGETADERWRDGDRLVCRDCKDW